MLEDKSLLDYTNLFFPNEFDKNKNNTKIFSIAKKIKMKKIYSVICEKYIKFEKPKISYIFENTLVLSIISSKCENEEK